jgi:uncharacterized membrane protein YtjA (UPF0391 family)
MWITLLKQRAVVLSGCDLERSHSMLHWAVVFLVVALLAAVFGFGGIAGTAAGIAKVLFFLFLVLFIVSLLMGRTRTPVV